MVEFLPWGTLITRTVTDISNTANLGAAGFQVECCADVDSYILPVAAAGGTVDRNTGRFLQAGVPIIFYCATQYIATIRDVMNGTLIIRGVVE